MLNIDTQKGEAPALIFVHGWLGSRRALMPIARHFPGQSQTRVALLGHDGSPAWTSWRHGEQAEALLESYSGRAILIGHSMGAQIAVEAAHMAPDRVEALVLLDPSPIIPHARAVQGFAHLRTSFEKASDAELPDVITQFGRGLLRHGGPHDVVEDMVATMRQSPPDLIRKGFAEICDWAGADTYAALQCPILVINAPGAANELEDLRRANKRTMGALVVGSGHMVHIEAPEQAAAMIRRFAEVSRAVILR